MNIDYPFHFDSRGRTASTSYADHVEDMIEQLLFTAPGERVNRPDFGTGVAQLTFAPNSQELAAALEMLIKGSLQRWLSDVVRIEADGLTVTAEDNTLRVKVVYTLLSTGETITATLPRPR